MYHRPIQYIKNGKTIVDFSLKFPESATIYFDLMIESMEKIEKKIDTNVKKINRIQRQIFNYVYPKYSLKIEKTNYYVSRAYLDGEINPQQEVYVCCFIDRVEIFPIDWCFIKRLQETKDKIKHYSHLNNKAGVYILKLQDDKYYIGSSHNIFRRLIQHWTHGGDCGSKWTNLFKPIELITWVITDDLLGIENLITKTYVSKYSPMNVRGGSFYI